MIIFDKKEVEEAKQNINLNKLIKFNEKNGYSLKDSISIVFSDAIELKRGKKEYLSKYGIDENVDPRIYGKAIHSLMWQKDKEETNFIPLSVKKNVSARKQKLITNSVIYSLLVIFAGIVFFPILLVFVNSFKSSFSIESTAFSFPTGESFVGINNYISGFTQSKFALAFLYSLVITVVSTALILVLTSMSAWFLVRVKTLWTRIIYYVIIFSMVVPFQMVMLSMQGIANYLYLDNIFGIILLYVGFGAGLSVFMYAGFVKSVPTEVEEAALIDGCNPVQIFFRIVFPILKPTTITIAVLNVMWIWNDYLLPYRVLGSEAGSTTIPVAIQVAMSGSYGSIQYGPFMAMMILTIIPVIVFYLFGQKYIIKGVTAGAVKG